MADLTRHFVAAIPDAGADLATANAVFDENFGWGPGNLSRKLTNLPNGTNPTHFLLASGITEQDWLDIEAIVVRNENVRGVTGGRKTAFRRLLYSVEPYGQRLPMEHVQEFMAANGLNFIPETI